MITNQTRQTTISENSTIADTFLLRLKGLLFTKPLKESESLVITRCNSIHMFFMSYAIDVIFVSKENKVVATVENIKPFCLSPIFFKSSFAIELSVGTIQKSGTQKGDLIKVANLR
jgi:uncharacterized membrane protein (UPF0127 family)